MLKTSSFVLLNIYIFLLIFFVIKLIMFKEIFWINRKYKEQHLSELEIFCNNVKVSVTFNQFNVSFLNKCINLNLNNSNLANFKLLLVLYLIFYAYKYESMLY